MSPEPKCGHCGARYLDRPDEFIFNGAHGKLAPEGNRRKEKAAGFRMIHKPCKGKPGARISTTLDHQGQKKQHDNVRLLRALVNGASINDVNGRAKVSQRATQNVATLGWV